jgi:3-oxoacyl-[acyl-carrier protein] reductase
MRKNIIIIGGTSGLGLDISEKLSQKYNVISLGRNPPQEKKEFIEFIKYDINSIDFNNEINEILSKIEKIYCVIFNIGGSFGKHVNYEKYEFYEELLHLNFLYAVKITTLVKDKIKNNQGKLIYMLTNSCFNYSGNTPYVAAKLALYGYINNIAPLLIQDNISVYGIAPTAIYYKDRYLGKLQDNNNEEWKNFAKNFTKSGRLLEKQKITKVIDRIVKKDKIECCRSCRGFRMWYICSRI